MIAARREGRGGRGEEEEEEEEEEEDRSGIAHVTRGDDAEVGVQRGLEPET